MTEPRDPLTLDDAELIRECDVDTYRASGPGGQHRNKTDSAVRLRHRPTGLIVTGEERRSQHQNKANALERLREALALKVRTPLDRLAFHPPDWFRAMLDKAGRLKIGRNNPRRLPVVRLALDVLTAAEGRVADAAALLGISTGNLSDFLTDEPKSMEEANRIRAAFGHKPLRDN
jgi:hypothetical protein